MQVARSARRFVAVLATVSITALATSCVSTVTGGTRRTGYAQVALAEAPDVLDPTQAATFVGRIVFANMCEKLYDVNAKLHVIPQLAAALPKVSDHGLVYTIPLRRGILFNDGTRFNAQAVRRSLLRDKNDKLSQRTSELSAVKRVDAVDDHTVRLTLSQPFAPITSVLADRSGMVMSPKALAAEGNSFGQHPVCVGPFSFQDRPSANEIDLKKSSYYYGKAHVHLAGIHFEVVTDGSVRATDIRSGDVDVVDRADPQDLQTLRSDSSLHVRSVTSLGYEGVYLNVGNAHGATKPPAPPPNFPLATKQKLRQAFQLSLDRNVINKVVFEGAYQPNCSPLPPGTYDVPIPCTHRDIAKAKKLIASTGVSTPIHVSLIVPNDAEDELLGTVIQAMAKPAGFSVSLQPTEFATGLTRAMNGQFQATLEGWSGRLDPDQNISQFVTPRSALNYSGADDRLTNALVARARVTTNVAARRLLYKKLVMQMNRTLPIIYLYRDKYALVVRSSITGVKYYGDGLIRLASASLTGS